MVCVDLRWMRLYGLGGVLVRISWFGFLGSHRGVGGSISCGSSRSVASGGDGLVGARNFRRTFFKVLGYCLDISRCAHHHRFPSFLWTRMVGKLRVSTPSFVRFFVFFQESFVGTCGTAVPHTLVVMGR